MRGRMEMKNLRLRFNHSLNLSRLYLSVLFRGVSLGSILFYISLTQVQQLLPRRVKKRRKVQGEDGSDQGWEEYFDYIFPEDEAAKPNLKLLAMAKMWKKNKEVGGDAGEEEKEEQEEEATETDVETESRRIDVMADKEGEGEEEDEENPDADDPAIANESDSSSSGSEDEEEEEPSKAKRPKRSK